MLSELQPRPLGQCSQIVKRDAVSFPKYCSYSSTETVIIEQIFRFTHTLFSHGFLFVFLSIWWETDFTANDVMEVVVED